MKTSGKSAPGKPGKTPTRTEIQAELGIGNHLVVRRLNGPATHDTSGSAEAAEDVIADDGELLAPAGDLALRAEEVLRNGEPRSTNPLRCSAIVRRSADDSGEMEHSNSKDASFLGSSLTISFFD